MEWKVFISIVVIILSFVAYIPYIIDIFKGKTKPHLYTWAAISLLSFIAYGLQVVGGAGVGSIPMFVVACICTFVFLLSIWKGTKNRTRSDVVFLLLSMLAFVLWIFAKQPLLSILLVTASEILAYVPTIRKSWYEPHSETLSLYRISMFRHTLAMFAPEKLNILTMLYPGAWACMNVGITIMLIFRRRKFPKQVSSL